ncbi:hypothetical protein [Acholeplasma laidlawii]
MIYELKPNNARAIKLGLKNLDRYADSLLKQCIKVIKILITY